MKKGKVRSSQSLRQTKSSHMKEETVYIPPLDILLVKVLSLQLCDGDPRYYAIKITFLDQLLLSSVIKPIGIRDEPSNSVIATGTMNFDPSDYEKMCIFADNPLIVNIQPLKAFQSNLGDGQHNTPDHSPNQEFSSTINSYTYSIMKGTEISCCNIDIVSMFIDVDEMCVKSRLEPVITPALLCRKSWDNLPYITMKLTVLRNSENIAHHEFLKRANYMKFSLVGAYNLLIPHDDSNVYMAATKLPMCNETNSSLQLFYQGHRASSRFNSLKFWPKWEALIVGDDDVFAEGKEKLEFKLSDLEADSDINVGHFLSEASRPYTTIWGSFHRTLLLGNAENWLKYHIRHWKWPLEVHIFREQIGGFGFMAFLDLFRLLYPGETKTHLAVPLLWLDPQAMLENCGCDVLLTPDKIPFSLGTPQKHSKPATESARSTSTETGYVVRPTGAENGNAFVIVEVKFARPLVKEVIPPYIPIPEISDMLEKMETGILKKRECTGRGQLSRNWNSTVQTAANALRRVSHYGMTEFCLFNRQLSETRTRVELSTSCWMDAAIFVNNNFVVQEFKSDKMFEEMLMMTHACLMRMTCDTLFGIDDWNDPEPNLKAARHARQMQDVPHAAELYLLVTAEKPYDADYWRELGTCLKDIDRDWANICYDRSLMLDIRHPLTLLAKGCMVYEEHPDGAEPFFLALLTFYPFWSTAWIAANAYFISRELYRIAEQIAECLKLTLQAKMIKDFNFPRAWEHELGDWWEQTPLLPGMSPYFDAADLLLRLRAVNLAEVCLSRALTDSGPSAAYFHFVALCCHLQGKMGDALCHLKLAIEKFGEISYLRSLEAECYHKNQDINAAMASFEKAGACISGYSILLSLPCREPPRMRPMIVDLLRRQPSAYAWMALADDWLLRAAVGEAGDAGLTEEQVNALAGANACAVQALRCDRRAGRAWAHLATSVKPSARRLHCRNMAAACGYPLLDERKETNSMSRQSVCHRVGVALRDCCCQLCQHLAI